MKKTYIYNLLLASALLTAVSSCKKPLDVAPVDNIEQENALVTSKDVEGAMVGSYADFGDRNFFGGRPFLMADFLADIDAIQWTGTYVGMTQMINKSIQKTNTFVTSFWQFGYASINDANNVLDAIDKVQADKKDRITGEAKFIRGSAYFELVRLFGKAYNDGNPATNLGVPIVLTHTTLITEANYVPRATVAAVYQQAIKDLTEAEAVLPARNSFYATKGAAAAMLARIYLQMGDYTNAANAANRVIASGVYALTEDFASAFPPMPESGSPARPGSNTTEDIFAVQITNLTGFNAYNEFYASSSYAGRGDAAISEDWITGTYAEDDDRINAFYDDGDLFTIKFGNNYGNVSVIRLPEMYLIRAEANARLGTAIGATPLADLAVVRTRAKLETTSATVADILAERKLEFAFEGFALHDAKRTQTNIGNLAWNANSLVFPIPQREMDANKSLIQNAGY